MSKCGGRRNGQWRSGLVASAFWSCVLVTRRIPSTTKGTEIMSLPDVCPLCGKTAKVDESRFIEHDGFVYQCPRCGDFVITTEALAKLPFHSDKFRLSGVTRHHVERTGKPLWLTTANLDALKNAAPRPTDASEKATILLRWLGRKSRTPGHSVQVVLSDEYPACFAEDVDELYAYLLFLEAKGFIEKHDIRDRKSVV